MKSKGSEKKEKRKRKGPGAPPGNIQTTGACEKANSQSWMGFTEKMIWIPDPGPRGGIGPTEKGTVDTGILSRVNQGIWTTGKTTDMERAACSQKVVTVTEMQKVQALGVPALGGRVTGLQEAQLWPGELEAVGGQMATSNVKV